MKGKDTGNAQAILKKHLRLDLSLIMKCLSPFSEIWNKHKTLMEFSSRVSS